MTNKVILAFTGGLQSSVCLHWLRDHQGCKVKVFNAKLGQPGPRWEFAEQALDLGADGLHVEDLREELCRDYAFRALKAGAAYGGRYLLSSALARPPIAAALTRVARSEGYNCVAHGAGSRSNDLARFEACIAALAPELEIIGPGQIPPLSSRRQAVDYAREHGLTSADDSISMLNIDRNLWGRCITADPNMDTWEALPKHIYELTVDPSEAPDEPEEVVLEFEKGIPVALEGTRLAPYDLVADLNRRAGRHGVGRVETFQDRLVGIKAREVYEAPAATTLMEAHAALEALTLDQETLRAKADVARRYAELVYAGGWFTQLREALDAFVDVTQEYVSGQVRLELFRGCVRVRGLRSPWSLYDADLVVRDEERELGDKSRAEIWSVRAFPYRVTAMLREKRSDRGRRIR